MAFTTTPPWYSDGTITTDGTSKVVGTGTLWTDVGQIAVGDLFTLDGASFYQIQTVGDGTTAGNNTILTVDRAIPAGTAQAYSILQNSQINPVNSGIAYKVSAMVQSWQGREDELRAWLAGTAGGGVNSDGMYPMTDATGVTYQVKCPAQMQADVDAAVAQILGGNVTVKSMNHRGAYLAATTYAKDDAVTSGGRYFISRRANSTGHTPPSSSTGDAWWGLVADRGGQGPQGPAGNSVDHITRTAGTGAAGTTDTYTLWGDVAETINMGTFQTYNGSDGTGTGDMLAATYDPAGVAADAFNMANMVESATNKILTATERTKLAGIAPGADVSPVTSVAGKTGNVTLSVANITDAGTAATHNVPAAGDAAPGEVVLGSDSRLGGGASQSDLDRLSANVALNAIRIAVNGNLSTQRMVDGIVDEYGDETGVDTANAVNQVYDSMGHSYSPATGLNLTLYSVATTAVAQPSSATLTVLEEDVDPVTLNTDLMAAVSRDGGATWTNVPLVDKGVGANYAVLSGSAATTAIPTMTNYTTPSGIVTYSADHSIGPAWHAFAGSYWYLGGAATGWIAYDFGTPTEIYSYDLAGYSSAYYSATSWTFDGWDAVTSSWVTLDTVTGAYALSRYSRTLSAVAKYSKYRLNITGSGNGTNANLYMGPIHMYAPAYTTVTKRILQGTADITAQPAGTAMKYRLTTANAKNLKLHGTSLGWK